MWYPYQIKNCLIAIIAFSFFSLSTLNAASELEHTVDELPYGAALYNFYQDNYFSAITDLLVAKKRQTIVDQSKAAELMLGSLYSSYGLQKRAHDIFKNIARNEARDIPQNILDQALFQIGKDFFINGFEEDAKRSLLGIGSRQKSTLGPEHDAERLNMLSEIHMHAEEYDAVLEMLDLFPSNSVWKQYTQFNLSVNLIKDGRTEEGMLLLEELAKTAPFNKEVSVLHDQANLALAAVYAKLGKPNLAIGYFENIKVRNPQANSALLGLGWLKFKTAAYDGALSAWSELSQRSKSDTDVQEALMLIPYALEKRGEKAKALSRYDFAIQLYEQEFINVERIKKSIEQGEVIKILQSISVVETTLDSHDLLQAMGPELSEYLFELLTSSDFNKAIRDYRDLAVLEDSLTQWEQSIVSMKLILNEKVNTYNNRLSVVINSLKFEYAKKLKDKRAGLIGQLDKALSSSTTRALVNAEEKELFDMLDAIKFKLDKIGNKDPEIIEMRNKYDFLAGLLKWNIDTDYAPRLWAVKKSIKELDNALHGVNRAIDSLTSVWEAAPAEHQQFGERINAKQKQIKALKLEVKHAMFDQEAEVQKMAENAIAQYRVYLKTYHDRALFGKARVYDSMVLNN